MQPFLIVANKHRFNVETMCVLVFRVFDVANS